jgi:glycosyltransferase involved in cell wall biosynthesis
VLHVAASLQKAKISTSVFYSEDYIDLASFTGCRAVIIFRAEWTKELDNIITYCNKHQIPVMFDIDDLIFDADIISQGHWAFYNEMSEPDQKYWLQKIYGYQKTLEKCDGAIVSTPFLREAVKKFCRRSFLLPNMLDEHLLQAATQAKTLMKPSASDGKVRIGFSSGTPTHKKDFGVVAGSLASILRDHKHVILTIVGTLQVDDYPELREFREQIEKRPIVSMEELMSEMYRFDINIAPLELNNPFCESKSALRYILASVVRTPSIVSPTQPLSDAVGNGKYGLIARDNEAWHHALQTLIKDETERRSLGIRAEKHALEEFGLQKSKDLTISLYSQILRQNLFSRRKALGPLRPLFLKFLERWS